MKKALLLGLMALGFSFLSLHDAQAQNMLGNRTGCDMIFAYAWSIGGACPAVGSANVVVPAYSAIPAPGIPAGHQIVAAKATYIPVSCATTYVGYPCTGYGFTDFAICPSPCGDYKFMLDPSWGVVAYQ